MGAIVSLLSSVADADAAAGILLTGEAGIGKTALWEAAVEAARERSFRVLAARPAEPEAEVSLAAIGDLLDRKQIEESRADPLSAREGAWADTRPRRPG